MNVETNFDKTKKSLKIALDELDKEVHYKKLTKELQKVIDKVEDAMPTVEDIVMKRITCTRCGHTYPKKDGNMPIMGIIKSYFQVVVEDSGSNEAVMLCKRCKRLFLVPIGIYIRIVE